MEVLFVVLVLLFGLFVLKVVFGVVGLGIQLLLLPLKLAFGLFFFVLALPFLVLALPILLVVGVLALVFFAVVGAFLLACLV